MTFRRFRAVWPDLAKFHRFGKYLKIFGNTVYLVLDKIFNSLWHNLNAFGQIFMKVNGQILKTQSGQTDAELHPGLWVCAQWLQLFIRPKHNISTYLKISFDLFDLLLLIVSWICLWIVKIENFKWTKISWVWLKFKNTCMFF